MHVAAQGARRPKHDWPNHKLATETPGPVLLARRCLPHAKQRTLYLRQCVQLQDLSRRKACGGGVRGGIGFGFGTGPAAEAIGFAVANAIELAVACGFWNSEAALA